MDGRGRVTDNIFIERLWRSLKYEKIYLNEYSSVLEVQRDIAEYFNFYNSVRIHEALDYRTPVEVRRA